METAPQVVISQRVGADPQMLDPIKHRIDGYCKSCRDSVSGVVAGSEGKRYHSPENGTSLKSARNGECQLFSLPGSTSSIEFSLEHLLF